MALQGPEKMRAVVDEPPRNRLAAIIEERQRAKADRVYRVSVYGQPGYEMVELGIRLNQAPRPGVRGACMGWTPAASRANRRFAASIDAEALQHMGLLGVTCTVRDCPPCAEGWAERRQAWYAALKRHGLVHWHWVTEWQRRAVPHLHALLVYPNQRTAVEAIEPGLHAWLRANRDLHPAKPGQRWGTVRSIKAIARYQAKHVARTVKNYQRDAAYMPASWRGRTGRVWGASQGFPRLEPKVAYLSVEQADIMRKNMARVAASQLRRKGLRKAEVKALQEGMVARWQGLVVWAQNAMESNDFWQGIADRKPVEQRSGRWTSKA